jgi:hypothetical protein
MPPPDAPAEQLTREDDAVPRPSGCSRLSFRFRFLLTILGLAGRVVGGLRHDIQLHGS